MVQRGWIWSRLLHENMSTHIFESGFRQKDITAIQGREGVLRSYVHVIISNLLCSFRLAFMCAH